ncbi:CGNR zinc finger domain-containing protein [Mycobacterium sp. 21AC1]|uniref:CGNR zinc finger domain-containing protein n=1 Tax=[Mycobacterium] appelbergii TaxID=2939269 RepID=UPI002939198D|nr:CGNR zinc finger domain-containing protein [Mycobacterium sp. 21AC1]MDV3127101.1 CGNR zinc finger domain-containing protein [Mycobacterium sp. 21AC1]
MEPVPIVLANTISIDRGRVHDSLAEQNDAEQWLRKISGQLNLTPQPPSSDTLIGAHVDRLVSLRDAVRRLAADQTQDPRTLGQSPVPDAAAATDIVNSSSALGLVWPEVDCAGPTAQRRDVWAGREYLDALITVIARQTIDLAVSPQWGQLHPCLAPGCAHFFVKDQMRRQWCSPHCGNRARVARHAHRHRTG